MSALIWLLVGCGPAKIDDLEDTGTAGVTDSAPTDDTGTTGTTDTSLWEPDTGATTTDTDLSPPVISELAWALDPEVVTLVEVTFAVDRAASVWVSWEANGEVRTSPVRAVEAGSGSVMLFGIPAETSVVWEVHAVGASSEVEAVSEPQKATTGALPSDLPVATLVDWDPTQAGEWEWLYTSVESGNQNFFGPYYIVILNRAGEVVWYDAPEDERLAMFPRIAPGGTHVVIDQTSIYAFGTTPELIQKTLDGRQSSSIRPARINLTYDLLPDGTVLYDDSSDGVRYWLTALKSDGTEEQIWDCYAWMSGVKGSVRTWDCQPNTVLWNEATNTVLWSMFQTSTVVEIDFDTGEVLRYFGQLDGGYAFDPPDAVFDLQHFSNYSADGTLMISTHTVSGGRRQLAREFVVNDTTQTLEQIWSYENDLRYYAQYAGEAKRLDNGNTLVGFGTEGAILEVTPDGEVAWGVEWTGRLVGQATFVTDLYTLNQGW